MIRRYAAETVGTFVIVFAPVALAATGNSDLLPAALVSGLSVMGMVAALGPISAAHFNPAVTLAFAVARRFPWKYVLPFWIAQVLGAVLAAGAAAVLFRAGAGVHMPANPGATARNLGTEIALSFMLMLTIAGVATDKRVSGATPALAIGMTVVFGVLIGGPITGGSMNPARSLGPALLAGDGALTHYWIYLVGPMIGAVLGSLVYEAIRVDESQAKGAPNELLDGLEAIRKESDT